MDFTNMKLPITVIGIVVMQFFGVIWFFAQQDSTINQLKTDVTDIQQTDYVEGVWELFDEYETRIDELESTQRVITDNYNAIMSDHKSFSDILAKMNRQSALPNAERREYDTGY